MTSARARFHLLVGSVRHRRTRHTTYDFTHHVWYLALDLDELDSLAPWPLLAHDRTALLEVRDRDHLSGSGLGLRADVDAHLAAFGLDPSALRVTLITYPRVLGYVFNPVAFYLCHDSEDRLQHVIAEVSNTHGDREVYDFPPADTGPVFHSEARKRMYVSPFIEADGRYELAAAESADRLVLAITEYEGGERTLYARINLQPRPLTTRGLLGALARDPVIPLKTIILIGWHALRLRWRGVQWRRYVRS